MTRAMQVIPVLDLRAGIVVHARRGQHSEYAPLRSSLVQGCEPVAVARALCAICRTRTVYVADLDAVRGNPVNEAALAGLASVAATWVDAGATTPQRAAALARVGVARNVVGTQWIGPGALPGRLFAMSAPPLVLSVDLRNGRLISPDLAESRPAAAAPLARVLEVRELLVIDLARAGTGSGRPLAAVAELAAALPVAFYAAAARATRQTCARSSRPEPRARWWPLPCMTAASLRDRCRSQTRDASASQALTTSFVRSYAPTDCSACQPGIPLTSSTTTSAWDGCRPR